MSDDRADESRARRRALRIARVAPLVALAGLVAYPFVAPGWLYRLRARDFDPVVWREAGTRPVTRDRLYMTDSLVASRLLDAMDRERVAAVLGPGDDVKTYDGYETVYWLGPAPTIFVTLHARYLAIGYDDAGRVARYRVFED